MGGDTGAIKRDAGLLYALVDEVQRLCLRPEGGRRYPKATECFFAFVCKAAEETKSRLDEPKLGAQPDVDELRLNLFKEFWQELHRFVKPAIDAPNLATPFPLLSFATSQLKGAGGMNEPRFVTLLTPELMYMQLPQGRIKDLAAAIGLGDFPVDLGFIQIPYSLSTSLFSNLVLYHELGHFLYGELSGLASIKNVEEKCSQQLSAKVEHFATQAESEKTVLRQVLGSWVHELFCDLVAIRLIGPAFSFAFADFIGLLAQGGAGDEWLYTYNGSHPAPARRFGEHLRLLEDDGWFKVVEPLALQRVQNMKAMGAEVANREQCPGAPTGLVDAFVDVLPDVRAAATDVAASPPGAVEVFSRRRLEVATCLRNGIVPSAAPCGTDSAVSAAVAVINAAFCFLLGEFDTLANKVPPSPGESEIAARCRLGRMVDGWTLKAVEDFGLSGGGWS